MENVIIEIMNNYGYIGIALLILIENLFPPIPSELILTFGGFMTISSNVTITGVIISATIGSMLGGVVLYYIGRLLNKERLIKIINSKYGKVLRLKTKDIELANSWFDSKGNKAVFFCRFIPVVRSLISIPAGMSKMPLIKFIVFTSLGSTIWNTILVLIGAFAGDKKDYILMILDKFSYLILGVIIFVLIIAIYRFYKKRSVKGDINEK